MKKKNSNQYAPIMIAIGMLLILAGGYQAFNPVLAVSAHDDSDDVQRMLAITTFEVTPMYTACDQLDMALLMSYDNNPQNGLIGWDEFVTAGDDCEHGVITQDQYNQIRYAAEFCTVDLPPDPARIDDTTDTLTTDKSSYSAGDAVTMEATGTNVGDETWIGCIMFYATDPDGYTREVYIHELDVGAGATESRSGSMILPESAAIGTWSIQSKWVDSDGTVHALCTINLGAEEILGINRLGGILSLLGILLLIGGFRWKR